MTALVSLVLIAAVVVVFFLVGRKLLLWYFRVDEAVEHLASIDANLQRISANLKELVPRMPESPDDEGEEEEPEVYGYTPLPEDLEEDDTEGIAEPVAPEPAEEDLEEEQQDDQDGEVSDEELSRIIRGKKKD